MRRLVLANAVAFTNVLGRKVSYPDAKFGLSVASVRLCRITSSRPTLTGQTSCGKKIERD